MATARKTLKMTVVGYGFMGGEVRPLSLHLLNNNLRGAHGFTIVPHFMYGRNLDAVTDVAQGGGFRPTNNLAQAFEGADIVDICLPNDGHLAAVRAAVEAGVPHIFSEKPLAATVVQAEEMVRLTRNVSTLVHYCYRFARGPYAMRKFLQANEAWAPDADPAFLGARSFFLQNWGINPEVPAGGMGAWRFAANDCGEGGVIDDLMGHGIDLVSWLMGRRLVKVMADTGILVPERPNGSGEGKVKITAVDVADVTARFEGGGRALLSATRFIPGKEAYFENEVWGPNGTARWELEDQQHFWTKRNGAAGWTKELATGKAYCPKGAEAFRSGLCSGYEWYFAYQLLNYLQRLELIEAGGTDVPREYANFDDALYVQRACAAIVESGKKDGGGWTNIAA